MAGSKLVGLTIAKIDLWGLFGTQNLSLNLGVQSKKRRVEKCRIFEKLRKKSKPFSFSIIPPANQFISI